MPMSLSRSRSYRWIVLSLVLSILAAAVPTLAAERATAKSLIVDRTDALAPKPVDPELLQGSAGSNGALTVVDTGLSRVTAARAIAPQPENIFGESVDLLTGNLRFFQTDIVLKGTGPDIAISRSLDVNGSRSAWWQREHAFADWKLELPRMSTFTPHPPLMPMWQVAGTEPNSRCTNFGPARNINGNYVASEWWNGVQLTIPGQGTQEVMRRASQNTLTPAMVVNGATLDFPLVTTDHWMISCLATTSNGAPGQGFLAVSPHGDKYWFDVLAKSGWEYYVLPMSGGLSEMTRHEAWMLPSRIEDRYGNAVTYTYDNTRLTGVSGSDGRALSLTWQSVNGISFISSITEQPGDPTSLARTWSYDYNTPGTGRTLHTVTLPSTSGAGVYPSNGKWTYSFHELTKYCAWWSNDPQSPACDDNSGAWGTNTGTAQSPSGVRGTFKVNGLIGFRHLPMPLPTDCVHEADPTGVELMVVALIERRYSGPGIDEEWVHNRCPAGGCPVVSDLPPGVYLVHETDPSGITTSRAVDFTWCGVGQGEVVRTYIDPVLDASRNIVSAKRIIRSQKAAANSGPFPARIGIVPHTYANRAQLEYLRPTQQRDIVQDGVTFTWKAETFDSFGQPARVKRSSTLGTSRTETTAYNNDLQRWHLSRIASVTEQSTGAVPFAQTFDAATGHVTTQSLFGKVEQKFTHWASGLVQYIKDPADHATLYSEYKRGIPQKVNYPNGTVATSVVDNLGQVTSTTDQTGFTTSYQYDLLSRLKKVTFPTGDVTTWSAENIGFQRVDSAEYGLAAGHWRQNTDHGNYRKSVYFDGRWNPVITREYDNSNPDGTDRFVVRRFDHANREVFVSYPLDSLVHWDNATLGVRTDYDALGRPTRREQDAEAGVSQGLLATTTEYASGFKTVVTNPRGFPTTTTYQAFDHPTYEAPLVVTAPETQTTTIVRNIFGRPTSMTRSGTWDGASISATRSLVYDAHQRLCKVVEPDAGVTVQDYDTAGNLWWQATGQTYTSATACNTADVAETAKSRRTYDTLNRLTGIDHPAGTTDVAYTYFDDGALKTAGAGGNTWTYTYNRRRLLETESLAVDGKTFMLDWNYNVRGHLSGVTYPSLLTVSFNPTVFGEPQQVGSYATGATYWPNGGLDGFNYGNGAVRDVTPNARWHPDRIRDTKVAGSTTRVLLDHTLTYDANGNLKQLLDGTPGGLESRILAYDGRDRLVGVTGAPTGDEVYAYDPLDNVRRAKQGNQDRRFHYHGTTRRLDRIASPTGVNEVSFTWNNRGELATRNWPMTVPVPVPGVLLRDGFESAGSIYTEPMAFDAAKRLVSYAGGGASYTYDAHGRRVSTSVPMWGTRYQVYSLSGQLMYVEDSGLNQRVDYLHLGNALVAKRARPMSSTTATTTYLHTDHRLTPSVESNTSGDMTLRTRLRSYGEPHDGVHREGPGFGGHAVDEVGNLVYMQQRYYDPLAMRFLSPDPVEASASSFNRYWYANSNPYSMGDPDGRQSREFNWENRRLGITPPPRHPDDWLGPALGYTLGGMMALPVAVHGGFYAFANPQAAMTVANTAANALAGEALGGANIAAGAATVSALTRARELQAVLSPRTQRAVTTAVVETQEGIRVIGTSEGVLRPAQRAALLPGEVAARGAPRTHAELNAVNGALEMGYTPISVSPSRPACMGCRQVMEELNLPIFDR